MTQIHTIAYNCLTNTVGLNMLWELAALSMGRSMLCEDHGAVTDASHADSISWAIVSPALAQDKTAPKSDKWGKVSDLPSCQVIPCFAARSSLAYIDC